MASISKVETPKKKVYFDTSFLIGLRKNEIDVDNDIDKEFPKSDWTRFVQDTFIDESWANGNWPQKLSVAKFYEEKSLILQENTHSILLQEYRNGNNFNFEESNQSNIASFLNGEHKDQGRLEEAYFKNLYDRVLSNKRQWFSIPISDKDKVMIDPLKIQEKIRSLIDSDIPFHIPLDSVGRYSLRILRNQAFLSSSDAIIDESEHIKSFSDLECGFPTIYNTLTYSIFIDCLMRPKTIYNKENSRNIRNPFDVDLVGCDQPVLISENLLPDFRISLPTLHYCDIFVTCDIHQFNIIKYLFPKYEKKIRLIPFKKTSN